MNTATPVLELDSQPITLRRLVSDLWVHRSLLPLLARQSFKGRFRAARLGVTWSVAEPLARGLVLGIVFTQVVPIETDVPYGPFILAGTATWSFLSTSITSGTTSITSSAGIAGRLYFSRLLLPAMPAASALLSYAVTLVIVIGLMLAYGIMPSLTLLALPFAITLSFILVWGLSGLLALLHVHYRDVGPMVATGLGIVFYATPVIYPSRLAGSFSGLLDVNPLAGAVAVIRWSLFAGQEPLRRPLLWSIAWTLVLGVGTLVAFRRQERTCVDRL